MSSIVTTTHYILLCGLLPNTSVLKIQLGAFAPFLQMIYFVFLEQ